MYSASVYQTLRLNGVHGGIRGRKAVSLGALLERNEIAGMTDFSNLTERRETGAVRRRNECRLRNRWLAGIRGHCTRRIFDLLTPRTKDGPHIFTAGSNERDGGGFGLARGLLRRVEKSYGRRSRA